MAKLKRELRTPEITIFRGTWQGMTYEQMADSSSYSANYLMRDIAPKFWKLLSEALEVNIGKSNCRLTIEKLSDSSQVELTTASQLETSERSAKQKIVDWGNAPIPSIYYGRDAELETLQRWITEDGCQLLGLWGLSGTGKTLLMKKLAEEIQEQYEIVIWRSLTTTPSLSQLLEDLLGTVGIVENNSRQLLPQLIGLLQSHSCLILLDGMEAILQPQVFSGKYLARYEDYGEFLRAVGESSHQSCVIFTSLENPGKIMPASSHDSPMRNYKLSGLTTVEAKYLLKREQIATKSSAEHLIDYYQGNPAILMTVARIIRELFNGNVSEFLSQKTLVFGEINQFLAKSYERISYLEREILYWLASETQPMSLLEIQDGIPLSIYPVELIEALESLTQRSLITTTERDSRSVFVLSPMMREFITNQFLAQIGNNFSLVNRQNSLSTENTIELGRTTSKPTHLSQWLQDRFESGWQPIAALFLDRERSPLRLRSAFSLRGEGVITRFKQISLSTDNSVSVLLSIAISPENSALKICVQAQPTPQQQILPANLQLSLKDADRTTLATIESEARDNFIQLPYFRGVKTEQFTIELNLNSVSYEEDFVI